MNILLINHYAGSPELGMEYRPYYLAKKWNSWGHNTIILAADQSHLRKVNPKIEHDFQEQLIDGIKYVWFKTPPYQGNGLARVMNMFSFTKKLYFNAKKIVDLYKPDVVIASSTYPLDNYIAHKISKIAGINFIYEVHDLWPLSPMQLGNMSKYHPFIVTMQIAENFAYKHCAAVVSLLPKTKEYMVRHGLAPGKWYHVPNGICLEEVENSEDIPEQYKQKLNQLKQQGYTLIAYTGTHGLANALDSFIDAAVLMQDEKVMFVLTGNGPEKPRLMEKAKNLNNVIFFDPVEKKQVPTLLTYFDILYVSFQYQPLFLMGISPNKVFDYMYAAKPIIMAIKAGNDLVAEAQAGISIEPENPQALVKAIKQIMALPEEERERMGQNGRKFVLSNHTYEILARRFLDVIEKVVDKERAVNQ